MNKPEKRELHTYTEIPSHYYNYTVSSYALSIRVYHSSLFEDPFTYACYTSLQYC